jgi:ribosomal protein L27
VKKFGGEAVSPGHIILRQVCPFPLLNPPEFSRRPNANVLTCDSSDSLSLLASGYFLLLLLLRVLQRGMKMHAGDNVGVGRDHTIWALIEGHVTFFFDHRIKRQIISVTPLALEGSLGPSM